MFSYLFVCVFVCFIYIRKASENVTLQRSRHLPWGYCAEVLSSVVEYFYMQTRHFIYLFIYLQYYDSIAILNKSF